MKNLEIVPNIINPIRVSIKRRAITAYNKEMQEIVDDFLDIKPVENNNLKKVYNRLIKQYSLQLAIKRISLFNILKLKNNGVKIQEFAHVARLSKQEQKIFIKNLHNFGKPLMLKMAIFKNNANKFINIALQNMENQKIIKKAGVDIKNFKKFLIERSKKDLNLDIIKNPIDCALSETIETIGMRLIQRIIENANKNPDNTHIFLKKSLDEKIFKRDYRFPAYRKNHSAWCDIQRKPVVPIDQYYDALPREKIIPLLENQIKKGKNG